MIIKRSFFALIDDIFNQSFFDEAFFNYHFDFEENLFQLKNQYRKLSLFSVCLHFLSCVRSCDKKSHYCKICSRVCDYHFVETNAYDNLMVCFSTKILGLTTSHRIDLDVFLWNAEYNLNSYTKDNGFCTFSQTFDYSQYFFAAFSGVLVRMCLNLTLSYFSKLFSSLTLVDERKIIEEIVKHGHFLLSKFWHETNINFFMNFLIQLIPVFVIKMLIQNQNLPHIMGLVQP